MRIWMLAVLLVFSVVVCGPEDAFAGRALDKGLVAAEAGKWTIALDAFNDAWREEPLSPLEMYNLGLAHANAGNPVPAIAWFEAYLVAAPDAPNRAEVQNAIAGLGVQAESNRDALFDRAIAIMQALPPDESFSYAGGKWIEAIGIAAQLAAVGRASKSYELAALAEKYALESGGSLQNDHRPHRDVDLDSLYAPALAWKGDYEEALRRAPAKGETYFWDKQSIYYTMLSGRYGNGRDVRMALENRIEATSPVTITGAAYRLWLMGDVDGLNGLAFWLAGKGAEYNPARVTVGSALLGLGHREDAVRAVYSLNHHGGNAPLAEILLGHLNASISADASLSCYGDYGNALDHMLSARFWALGGSDVYFEPSAIQGDPATGMRGDDVPGLDAWGSALKDYAGGRIEDAIPRLRGADQDVSAFLTIALRNAATRDPLYAARIAALMEPGDLAPFMLDDAAEQAFRDGDKNRARILAFEADKLVSKLGGQPDMIRRKAALRSWIDLALRVSRNRVLSDLPGVLKLIASGGDATATMDGDGLPAMTDADFDYACPPDSGAGVAVASAPWPASAKGYEYSQAPEISEAAQQIGDGLMWVQSMRRRFSYPANTH